MARALTRAEHATLRFIKGFVLEHGYAPSIREIARGIGGASGAVHHHVGRLVEGGQLRKTTGSQRNLEVLEPRAIAIELDPDMERQVQALAHNAGTTVQAVIIECVRDRLALLNRSDFVVENRKPAILRAGSPA